jgi:hypothetical protein
MKQDWNDGTISTQEKFPRTAKFSKNIIVEELKIFNFKIFSDEKFVSANHILQNFLSVENVPESKCWSRL